MGRKQIDRERKGKGRRQRGKEEGEGGRAEPGGRGKHKQNIHQRVRTNKGKVGIPHPKTNSTESNKFTME